MGHIDTTGKVIRIENLTSSVVYEVSFPKEFAKYIIPHGSITINGTSLTIANHTDSALTVAIIPHTLSKTIIKDLRVSDLVNLEFDMIGKYVERMIGLQNPSGLTIGRLEELGY
jgi:riboflavin synthase